MRIFFFLLSLFFGSCCLAQEKPGNVNKKFTVVIDAGHGGKDPGAVGSEIKLKEKDINLAVALKLGALLEKEKDVNVIYTRKTDVFISLDERPRIANKAKADLFISIHSNSAASSVSGTETYVLGSSKTKANMDVAMRENSVILLEDDYKTRYEGFDPKSSESYIMFDFMQFAFMDQSLNFASFVQDQLKNTGNRTDRGVRQAGFLVLKHAGMPSVLVEVGYVSNTEEETYLSLDKSKDELANSIYKAFLTYKEKHEKKSNVAFEDPASGKNQKDVATKENRTDTTASQKGISYRVQFYYSNKKRPLDDQVFKGLTPVKEYVENNMYKYMYGESTSYREALKLQKSAREHFKDAFIVVFKEGKRLPPKEAQAYFK